MQPRIGEEITIRRLEMLLAFLGTGSLAAAAEKLETSAVSVHRALHALEDGLRCALFRHEGRLLVPTEAALVLAEATRDALGVLGDGIAATRAAGGWSADRIRIGALYSLTVKAVPQLVIDMKLRRPGLRTELSLGSNADLLAQLRQGGIDAALMALPEGEADIESVPLFQDEVCFAAPIGSPYAGLETVDLSRCRHERFVSLTDGFVTLLGFVDAFRIAGFEPDVVMKVGDIFSLMNLVSGGIGYTLLPGRVRRVFADRVQLIPLQEKYRTRQAIVLSFLRSRERDPNVLALTAACRQSAKRPESLL